MTPWHGPHLNACVRIREQRCAVEMPAVAWGVKENGLKREEGTRHQLKIVQSDVVLYSSHLVSRVYGTNTMR